MVVMESNMLTTNVLDYGPAESRRLVRSKVKIEYDL